MSSEQHLSSRYAAVDVATGPECRLSEAEFVAWCGEDEMRRAEWVDGEVVMMSPVSFEHSQLNIWLTRLLGEFIDRHDLGVVCGPEFTVRFADQHRRRVPDLLFVAAARAHRIQSGHLEGAPDLAVEIVSPESAKRDRTEKFEEYRLAGVREYWLIDLADRKAEFFSLDASNEYRPIGPIDGMIHSVVLPRLRINPGWLWPDGRPKVLDALREIGLPGLDR
jgi:Uma2 family endonuclease